MNDISDDYILITGASSGIGRNLAIALSKSHKLILHGRDQNNLDTTLNQCEENNHILWNFDLKNKEELSSSLKRVIVDNEISVSKFIHSAGMTTILPARNLSHQIASDIMAVNCLSALEIVSVLMKKSINNKKLTNIIFISSIWSKFGAKGYTLYCASKGALDSAMRALALELAPITRVNSILFGAIETPMAKLSFSDEAIKKNFEDTYPLGTGKVEDASEIISFLLSEKSKWITGQEIIVDGGKTINMSPK